jgi:ABC-type sugar transport system substrate-binding protein
LQRPYIRLFLPDGENPYQLLQAENAAASADRLALTLDVDFADGDFGLQIRQIVQATRQEVERPDVVMVMPVQETALKSLSEETVRGGCGWIYLNRTAGNVGTLRQLDRKVPTGYVAPDQREIGRVHARILRSLFAGRSAHVVYLQGRATTSSAQERRAGFVEGIQSTGPRIEITGVLDGNWTARDADAAMTRWLQLAIPAKIHIDAVVCQSDFMASGVQAALTAAVERFNDPALGTLPVIGCDGMTSVGKRLVDQGRLAATVVVPSTADKALAAVIGHRNGTIMPEEILLVPRAYPDESVLERQARHSA